MRPADAGAFALPAAAAALLAAALLFGGGSSDTRLFWIGGAALLVAAVAVVWRPPALTGPALGFLLCLGALAGKVFAGIEPDYGRLARLRWPLAYWNQLALIAAMTVPLGLWLAGRRD